MKNEKLYREAIKIAAPAEERFLAAFEANRTFEEGGTLREEHHRMKVYPAAVAACAKQSLIAELFDVSEEKVHEDITQLLTDR